MVTLLALPLGYVGSQAKIVRVRRSLLELLVSRGGFSFAAGPHRPFLSIRRSGPSPYVARKAEINNTTQHAKPPRTEYDPAVIRMMASEADYQPMRNLAARLTRPRD
ncbi:MAG: hypothetical protein C5B58_01740 [Acidobacteria bacterium]|nr:MAG: hypothetical protein C5B58_01740 [Acidobacteriota bacterium]